MESRCSYDCTKCNLICDNDYLLVSEYGMNRDDAEIIIYKKRDK